MNLKSVVTNLFLAGALLLPIAASSINGKIDIHNQYVNRKTSVVLETLTVYNPHKRQCDSSPFITASNARISAAKLKNSEIRWMALSRDLLKRWKGQFHYGDTVIVNAGDPAIDGVWVIQDTLNKRYKNRGDLLFDSSVRKLGKWNNVQITRADEIAISSIIPG